MSRGRETDYILMRQRLRLAREIVCMGGCLSDFARACGISAPGASLYLRRHAPATHKALCDGRGRRHVPVEQVINRLQTIKKSKTKTDAAKKLGITVQGLVMFLGRYAPDGIDDALELYRDEMAAPLLEYAA